MQKYTQVALDKLKKHYLVIIQIALILFFLSAFWQTIYSNSSIIFTTYKLEKVGEISISSPSLLFRDSENQKISIMYQSNYSGVQPIDVKVTFTPNNPSIEVAPEITFSNIQNRVIAVRSLSITARNVSVNTRTELLIEINANGTIVESSILLIEIESQTQYVLRKTSPYILLFLIVSLAFTILYQNYFIRRTEADNNLSRRLEIAEIKVDETPDKVKPIWDVARFTLEKYINRNQQQINLIFALSLGVMLVSFIIIIVGVYIAIRYPASFSIAILTTGVGVITEFIGATFLFVFKSTLKQASDYSKTLERIATIGVAVQILDTLVDDTKTGNIKSKTKSEVVKLLIKNTVISNEKSEDDNK